MHFETKATPTKPMAMCENICAPTCSCLCNNKAQMLVRVAQKYLANILNSFSFNCVVLKKKFGKV